MQQFFRLEAGRTELERVCFDVRALLHDTLATYVRRAEEKGVSLAIGVDRGVPTLLEGDPLRLGQMVANLVDNAVKFTEAGEIEVSVQRRAALLRFAVRDTGIGLTPAERTRVFEEFVQAHDSTTRKYGGMGLGLAIVRRLVALMDGKLGVDSTPGRGSTFWFEVDLPCAEAEPVPAAPCAWREESLAGRRVLLVEDAPDGREVSAAVLRRLGLEVEVACDGAQAVAAAAAKRYDAVLLDIAMPVMDGFAAARRIREHERGGREVPIIAISAHATHTMFERCLDAGIDDCLAKPLTREGLAAALLRWIEAEPATGKA